MTPEMESAVLKETEEALDEFINAAKNIGLPPATLILMLNAKAEELRNSIQ